MYLMYVDESGDTGLAGSPTRYFGLSGIVVHERRWRSFIEHLLAFRKNLRSIYGLPVRTELHSSEFIRSPIANLKKHERLAFLRNALDELAKFPDISVTSVIVDKSNKPTGYDAFQSAWGTLFQRFENTLRHANYPGGFRDDYGIVLTDATAGHKLSRLVRRMSVYNPIPSSFGFSPRNIPITKIIEDPHGKDSKESLPVQMADVCAYFLTQKFAPNSYVRRNSATNYYDRLMPILNVRASRSSSLGIVEL